MASARVLLISLALMAIAVEYASSKEVNCTHCLNLNHCAKDKKEWSFKMCETDKNETCTKINDGNGKTMYRGCKSTYECNFHKSCHSCDTNWCNNSSTSLAPYYIIAIVAAAIARFH